jgi:hypothetical protein
MKAVIILFIVALAVTCGYPQSLPTYPKRVGVMNCPENKWGVRQVEMPIPDMQMVDGYASQKMMTGVTDADPTCCPGTFPIHQL